MQPEALPLSSDCRPSSSCIKCGGKDVESSYATIAKNRYQMVEYLRRHQHAAVSSKRPARPRSQASFIAIAVAASSVIESVIEVGSRSKVAERRTQWNSCSFSPVTVKPRIVDERRISDRAAPPAKRGNIEI